MRVRLAAILFALLAISWALCACAVGKMDVQPETGFTGLALVVWDLSQTDIQGAPDYETEVRRIASEFASAHGVEVELRFAGRQEVSDMLLGKTEKEGEEVDLVCTGEWPFIPDAARDLSALCSQDAYVDAASSYWRRDGKLLAVPAYFHWTATAHRPSGTADAYLWDSPLFLSAALFTGALPPDPDEVVSYLAFVLKDWGEAPRDPFLWWEDGTAKSFYPFTPHLWQRARSKDSSVTIGPVRRSDAESFYYYTVPAYVVLTQDAAEAACASKLAALLAGNLGRWAARALSCAPALREDASVFNLESGLGFEDRSAMLSSLSALVLTAPSATEHILWESLEEALRGVAKEYLSGDMSEEEARRGIRETLERHTKP